MRCFVLDKHVAADKVGAVAKAHLQRRSHSLLWSSLEIVIQPDHRQRHRQRGTRRDHKQTKVPHRGAAGQLCDLDAPANQRDAASDENKGESDARASREDVRDNRRRDGDAVNGDLVDLGLGRFPVELGENGRRERDVGGG